jgi:hypothetical protein
MRLLPGTWATWFILAMAATILLSGPADAAVYHVSNDGADSNAGTSPETAWRSLGHVNAQPFEPGDSILFRRGDMWRGQIVPRSGSEAGHITYGAYGEGDKPLLLGSVEKNRPEDWQDEGGNIWATREPEPAGPELLHNPNFTENTDHWGLHHEGGASASGSRDEGSADATRGSYRLRCNKAGEESNYIQLYTGGIAIRQDGLYRLTFRARCDAEIELPMPALMKGGPTWDPYARRPSAVKRVTPEWQTFTQLYWAALTADDARVTWFLGDVLPDGAEFSLDAVSLVECGDADTLACDVGNIIFDGEASCGVKVWNEPDLDQQDEYWYDEDRRVLKVFSEGCPASRHSDIECALRRHIIDQGSKNCIIYENLALMYGAAHGIGGANTHHIIVRDCDFGYIGGGDQRGGDHTVRFGNGVEFWANAHDNVVERCRLWEIYDAALTNQNNSPNVKQYNLCYRNNIIWNSEYSFEYWNRPENSETYNIYFEDNTCVNAGHGWGNTQRPDPSGRHLCFYTSPAAARNIVIRNNIFFEATRNAFYAPTWPKEAIDALVMDNNCWYQAEGDMIAFKDKAYTMALFGEYQTDHGKEPNSIVAVPGFVNAEERDYRLSKDSPCIDRGGDTATDKDFAGTEIPQGKAPDIGAFER